MPVMAEAFIDRLTLQVPGLSETKARRLALAIADGLAAAGLPDDGAAGDVRTLRVELAVSADTGPDRLAGQIVSAILQQLQQLP